MTDLEMTKLCAEAMGLRVATEKSWDRYRARDKRCWVHLDRMRDGSMMQYDPLASDRHAMPLLYWLMGEAEVILIGDEFHLNSDERHIEVIYSVTSPSAFRRAIVECVAKMQDASVARNAVA